MDPSIPANCLSSDNLAVVRQWMQECISESGHKDRHYHCNCTRNYGYIPYRLLDLQSNTLQGDLRLASREELTRDMMAGCRGNPIRWRNTRLAEFQYFTLS